MTKARNKKPLVGRYEEIDILMDALETPDSEFIAVYGRRRIGKTYLIQQVYEKYFAFQMIGLHHGNLSSQLKNFTRKLEEYSDSPFPIDPPKSWNEAFELLKRALKHQKDPKRRVLFFDELPWLATHKSGFLEELGYFWNDWLIHQNYVIVVCGSAASWMIDKVILQKGGLHNRVTRQINLKPFTLQETEEYLHNRGVLLDRYQLVQLYMAIGGVAHYLKRIEPGMSATQAIDALCFGSQAPLADEFQNLYAALFLNHKKHVEVIKALSTSWQGLTRSEIVHKTNQTNGGGLTNLLAELEWSSFITTTKPFGKKKRDTLYRLTDAFSLFYLRFMAGKRGRRPGTWMTQAQGNPYKAWCGYAFENVCLLHAPVIVKALGVSGIHTDFSSFVHRATENLPGAQIDLVIDRADQAVTLCELKFHQNEFTLSKAYAKELRIKREVFQQATKSKKQLFWCLITTYDLLPNAHSTGLIDHHFNQDILFTQPRF